MRKKNLFFVGGAFAWTTILAPTNGGTDDMESILSIWEVLGQNNQDWLGLWWGGYWGPRRTALCDAFVVESAGVGALG